MATFAAVVLATHMASGGSLFEAPFDLLENRAMPVLMVLFYGIILLLAGVLVLVLTLLLLATLMSMGALCVVLTVTFVTTLDSPGVFSQAATRWSLLGLYLGCCFVWPVLFFMCKRTWADLARSLRKCRATEISSNESVAGE